MDEREEVIFMLYHLGLSQREIVLALSTYGYILSERHLRRILSKLALRRRSYSDMTDVVRFIQNEMNVSGSLHGYRWMHQKCIREGLNVRQRDVQLLLKFIDPIGVELR